MTSLWPVSRQTRTLLIGAVLCVVLGVLTFGLRVPYVILSPGPTVNTLGQDSGQDIISVTGRPVSPTTGHLNLTTIEEDTQDATVLAAIKGWLAHDEVVVPREAVIQPGLSQQQSSQQDAADFAQSQDSATAAAACELNYPKGFGVLSVQSDSPNNGLLKPGDQFSSINGTAVTDYASLSKVLATLKAGQTIPAIVKRAGATVALQLKLQDPPAGSTTPRLGISVTEGCLLPFTVSLRLTGIGGPSAGLMFALGIIDKISTDDLTHGRFIAGTGEIEPSGKVDPIGGIQLKMIAARKAGATIFLAPAGNCSDVRGAIPAGLNVVKVASLHEAVTSLQAIQDGKPVSHC
ncbi:MAG: hypothetical protein JWN95_552 [Frankiales bacterium]|nr:hypothetical protein [Frankiales bacterium]